MTDLNPNISIIVLKINKLNTPTNKERLPYWLKINYYMLLTKYIPKIYRYRNDGSKRWKRKRTTPTLIELSGITITIQTK